MGRGRHQVLMAMISGGGGRLSRSGGGGLGTRSMPRLVQMNGQGLGMGSMACGVHGGEIHERNLRHAMDLT